MKIISKIAKIVGWTLIALTALVLLFVMVIQTRPVKNKITQIVQAEVNNLLKAQLHVESIDGNFIQGLGLNGVFLEYENDTIGYIAQLKLKYKLLPLLKGSILVNSAEFEEPVFYLTQYGDSTWNFSNIAKPSENPDTVPKPFKMRLNIENIKINNGNIFINALDTVYPRRVRDLYTDLSFRFSSGEQEIDLREMRFNAFRPDLVTKGLKFRLKRDAGALHLEDFLLRTARNQVKADASFNPENWVDSHAKIETAPLQADEFQFLFPKLKITGNPKLSLNSAIEQSNSTVDLKLSDSIQGVDIQVVSENLADFLNKNAKDPLNFKLAGKFDDFNLKQWVDDPALDYQLTGTLTAEGSGVDYKKMQAKVKGDFKNMALLKRQVGKLAIDLDYDAGDAKGRLEGSGNFGSIRLVPNVKNLWSKTPSYTARVNTRKLDLSKILLDKSMKSDLTLNGNLNGAGIDPKTMTANFRGKLTDAEMYDFSVDALDVALNYRRGDVQGNLVGSGDFGKVAIRPDISRLLSKSPSYTAHVVTENLNLASLLSNDSLPSNLNVEFDVAGRGFNPKQMSAEIDLFAHPSSIMGIDINQLAAQVNYSNRNIDIDSLFLATETITLNAIGNYSLAGSSDLTLGAEILNASEIARILKIDSLQTSGNLHAHVFGRVDSLQAKVDFQLDSTRIGSNAAASLTGKADGYIAGTDTLIRADIFAGKALLAGFALDTVKLTAASSIRSTDLTLNADGKDVKTSLNGNVALGEDILVRLDDMMLDYKGSDWKLTEPPATIRIGKDEYEIDELWLVSGGAGALDSMQIIHADGLISRNGEQDLDLKLFNIDIPSVLGLFNVNQDVKGTLDVNMHVRGTADVPELEGGFNVDGASLNDYKFTEMAGTIRFEDKKLVMDAGIIPRDSGMLELTGFVPFDIQLDSMKVIPPKSTDSVSLKVLADRIPLKIISAFYPLDKAEGYVQGNILVDGTMANPNPIGDLHIVDGKIEMKKYGIDYRKVLASINFEKETVTVDTIFIRSKDGTMLADGAIGFNSQFYKGDVQNSEIQIKFDNFHPFNHKYYNMEISGGVGLHGKKDSVYFDGDVDILESLVYLPAVMNLIGGGKPPEIPLPLLISELESSNQKPDSVIFHFRSDADKTESVKFNYFDNIQGKIKVYIPRNTWIRNEQMRFEIGGDMEVIKHRNSMELFGTVDVIRGQYELLGKIFVVDEGTITFQGGKDFNPMLNVAASYSVKSQNRSDDSKLTINVTGELKEPKISFMMGGEQLTEGDALSYILFGTNMDALASGQEAAISASAGTLATGAAASLISSELTKLLGRTLNVDYIEMRAGSSFENTTFVVGKYIANKLFVSYERRFGDFKDEKVAEYEVKLEYELFRFLFLQLASSPINNGMDLIFKINSKTNFKE